MLNWLFWPEPLVEIEVEPLLFRESLPIDSYLLEYSYLSGLLYEVILGLLRLITGFLGALWKKLAQTVME